MIQNKKYAILSLAALVIAIITGTFISSLFGPPAGAQAPGGPQGPMPVVIETVKAQPVQIWKEFSGRLEAVEFVEIRPQVSGVITDVHFQDGDLVEAGQKLFTIDVRPYAAAVNLATAELQAAQNRLKFAEKELKRASDLIKTKAISTRIYDERENARDVADAAVTSAEAMLEQAQINLDYANVDAPISGRAGRVEVKQGNVVQAGQAAPILTTIVASGKIYADFEVDERTYIASISEANSRKDVIPVQMTILNGERSYDGVVDSFDNQLDVASGTIRARALFNNESAELLPGMFAQIKMGSAEKTEQILVPTRAIGTDQDRKYLYSVSADNMIEYLPVTLGETVGKQRVVLSGLKDGDKIITEGIIRLRAGMPVKPMTAEQMQAMQQQQQAAQGGSKNPQKQGK